MFISCCGYAACQVAVSAHAQEFVVEFGVVGKNGVDLEAQPAAKITLTFGVRVEGVWGALGMRAPHYECYLVLELEAMREAYFDQWAEMAMSLAEAECGLVVGCLDNATEDSGW